MNADLQAEIDDAIGDLQAITGETVTLAGISYTCTAATMLNGSIAWEEGGAADMHHIGVCVLQEDLPVQPPVTTPAVFRGVSFRVKSVDDAENFWQILLVQEFA